MKFLVTGLPRTRSAWFTALFNAHGCYTEHELLPGEILGDFGRCDPMAACRYPRLALVRYYRVCPIVIIEREPSICRASLEAWGSRPLPRWDSLVANYEWFRDRAGALRVPYCKLANYSDVSRIVEHCTGRALSRGLFDIFDRLKIEQHLEKAQLAHAA